VMRFWNNEIFENPEGVTDTIVRALEERASFLDIGPTPHPPIAARWAPPSPAGRGVKDSSRE